MYFYAERLNCIVNEDKSKTCTWSRVNEGNSIHDNKKGDTTIFLCLGLYFGGLKFIVSTLRLEE